LKPRSRKWGRTIDQKIPRKMACLFTVSCNTVIGKGVGLEQKFQSLFLLLSQGETGLASTHNPRLAFRASRSARAKRLSFEYVL